MTKTLYITQYILAYQVKYIKKPYCVGILILDGFGS